MIVMEVIMKIKKPLIMIQEMKIWTMVKMKMNQNIQIMKVVIKIKDFRKKTQKNFLFFLLCLSTC
jgi:hypothetical protein